MLAATAAICARARSRRAADRRAQQHVVDAVGAAGAQALGELLQLRFDGRHAVGIEQLAQLGLAEQLAQLV